MRRVAIAALAALCLSAPATAAGPTFGPKPGETVPQLIGRMKAALRAPGCNAQLKGLFFGGFGSIPQAGCDYLRAQLGKFEHPEGKICGTGAVLDGYKADGTDNYAEAVFVLAHQKLGIGAGKKADICARVQSSSLHKLLAAEPRAVSKRFGGTSDYAFYGIRFKHSFTTVVMAQQPLSVYIPKSAQCAFIGAYSG